MKVLSSTDEILLLAVQSLKDNAYGVTIRRQVSSITKKDWSIGAIYDPLYRMEERGLVCSELVEPTNEIGGRSRRMFNLTEKGKNALLEHKRVRDEFWSVLSMLDENTVS